MSSLHRDVWSLLNLAWPVIISRLGIMTMTMVDIAMVGHYSSEHLAYMGLGMVPHNIYILILLGLLMGTPVLVSNAYGAGNLKETGRIWWLSLSWGLGIGAIGLVVCAFGEQILLLSGQTPELSEKGGRISFIAGLSLPLIALYMTTGFFLEGTRNPRPGMVIMIAANIVNIFANYLLVYGLYGFPELGAEGSLWASLIVRCVQIMAIFSYIWFLLDREKFGINQRPKFIWAAGRRLRQIGYASGISMGVENTAFNVLALFAGILGALVVAAHVITITLFALFFMIGLGLAIATSVSVGNAYGAGDMAAVARWGRIGLGVQMAFMSVFGVIMYLFAAPLASIYTTDPKVLILAVPMIAYASIAVAFDAAQTLVSLSLRARGDTWFPTGVHIIAYGVIMMPVTYIACFSLERGALGLIDGIVIGILLPFFVLLGRTAYLDCKAHPVSPQTAR